MKRIGTDGTVYYPNLVLGPVGPRAHGMRFFTVVALVHAAGAEEPVNFGLPLAYLRELFKE